MVRKQLRRVKNKILSLAGMVSNTKRDKKQEVANLRVVPKNPVYNPVYTPWLDPSQKEFIEMFNEVRDYTLVSIDRCWLLYSLCIQQARIGGTLYECGVYKGGTAFLFSQIILKYAINGTVELRLFDTFSGMPETIKTVDWHNKGDFADTSIGEVKNLVGTHEFVNFYEGYIPQTFFGLNNDVISFAHVDVDIYQSVLDCCEFIYPRLSRGGVIVFDDYGFVTCEGAKLAVDKFFADKVEVPLVFPTGQAIIVKS